MYGALFIYMVWVMADRMPLYGYLRVGLAVLFFFDYFVWRLFRQSPAMQGRAWVRKGLTLFYFLPFVLLVVFCAVLSFRDLQDWAPFWRTYLAGSVFVLLSTHFCYGAVWAFFSILAWFRSGRLARCGKNRNLSGLEREGEPGGRRPEAVPVRLDRERQDGKFPYQAAGYASFLLLLLIVYAMVISTFNLRIDKIDMRRENPDRLVPGGLRGYKILQISDLHIGSFTSARQVRSLVRQALLTRPDMIVFTGDMVNLSTSEMTPFMSDLAHLQAPDGVYCVLGNHDYGNYAQWPDKNAKYANFQKMLDYYKRLGWVTLNNASVKIERGGDTLWLIGVENWGKEGRFPKRGNLKKAMLPESVLEVRQSWRQAGKDAVEPVPGNAKADAAVSTGLSVNPGVFSSSAKAGRDGGQ